MYVLTLRSRTLYYRESSETPSATKMTEKRILLSLLESNKVITILDETGFGDVKYVIQEFRRMYDLKQHMNGVY